MNQHLQTILNFIEQSTHLSNEEKAALIKAVKDANKEIEITSFKLDRAEKVKRTTSILLEETIEELEKKRKHVEAQNSELEIESSLEKVRTVAMSMSKANDLLSICETMFHELKKLGFDDLRNAMIDIHYDDKNYLLNYDYSDESGKTVTRFTYNSHPIVDNLIYHAKQSKESFTEMVYAGKKLEEWRIFRKQNGEADDARLDNTDALYYYFYSIGTGAVGISIFKTANEKQLNILKRFRNVFDLAYKRYVDISNAEAQAREAQIEAALERVRAVAMAMKKSEELITVCEVMYKELLSLRFTNIRNAQIAIENDERQSYFFYVYSDFEKIIAGEAGYNSSPVTQRLYKELGKSGGGLYEREYSPEEMEEWRNWRRSLSRLLDEREETVASLCWYIYAIGKGHIGISTFNAISTEQVEIVKRFKKVFELSYTRFDDLQKAEAQAREAQVETALEKIRSRSLAMHRSNELKDVIAIMFEKSNELNVLLGTVAIWLFNKTTMDSTFWVGNNLQQPSLVHLPYNKQLMLEEGNYKDSWQAFVNGESYTNKKYSEDEKNRYFKYVFENNDLTAIPADARNYISQGKGYTASLLVEKNSSLYFDCWNGATYNEESINVLRRITKVFEQAYVRFLDLQKAEAQAREAQIELGLERVRARAMAMHQSGELAELIDMLFKELTKLGFSLDKCIVMIMDEVTNDSTWWISPASTGLFVKYKSFKPFEEYLKEWRARTAKWFYILGGEEKKEWGNYIFYDTELALLPEPVKTGMHSLETVCLNVSFGNFGSLTFSTLEPLPEKEFDILMRFANVFNQTYTRFLDLQKAEAQTREAQIEAALEKVRSRSLAMQKSTELNGVVDILYAELVKLEKELDRCFIMTFDSLTNNATWWMASRDNVIYQSGLLVPFSHYAPQLAYIQAWKNRIEKWTYLLEGKEKAVWDEYLFEHTQLIQLPDSVKHNMRKEDKAFLSGSFQSFGCITTGSFEPLNTETFNLLTRFAKVFEQTYTRFLDLQKAEAQARETQIQLALERVRARTMAMQKSDELQNVVFTMYEQLQKLDFTYGACTITIMNKESGDMDWWMAGFDKQQYLESYHVNYFEHPGYIEQLSHWKNGDKYACIIISGDEKKSYDQVIFNETDFKRLPGESKKIMSQLSTVVFSMAYMKYGALSWGPDTITDEQAVILQRFSQVFEQTYTRFLDLQKAETQARESQIEAALERVRSVAMSMMKSEELKNICEAVFKQLSALGFDDIRAAQIYIRYDDEEKFMNYDYSDAMGSDVVEVNYNSHAYTRRIYDVIKNAGDELIHNKINKKELDSWKSYLYETLGQPSEKNLNKANELHYYLYSFGTGAFGICTFKEISNDELQILKRFRNVFSLSYQRYTDISHAEIQTRESQIELSLERVRSRAMMMQKSEDLSGAVAIVFEELNKLSIGLLRCGIGILHKEKRTADVFTTTIDNNSIMQVTGDEPMDIHPLLHNAFESWLKHEDYEHVLKGQELNDYYKSLNKGNFRLPQSQLLTTTDENTRQYYVYTMFSFGGLFAFSNTPISDETKKIMKRFANVFEQTYTRFLDIKKAEAQAREAHIEAALERVRAAAMSMMTSQQLLDVCESIYHQLLNLGFDHLRCAQIYIFGDSRDSFLDYEFAPAFKGRIVEVGYNSHPEVASFVKDVKNTKTQLVEVGIPPEKLDDWKNFLYGDLHQSTEPLLEQAKELYYYHYAIDNGALSISTFSKITDEQKLILERLRNVFSLSYKRYTDLAFAEKQAREAQIETALERVRSRTLAMQKSNELAETSAVLFKQLISLGISPNRLYISIMKDDIGNTEFWITDEDGTKVSMAYEDDLNNNSSFKKMYDGWKLEKKSLIIDMKDEELQEYFQHLNSIHVPFKGGFAQKRRLQYIAYFSKGFIGMASPDEQPAETLQLLERFAYVFNLTFTRFNDLQIAEAHAVQAEQDLIEIKNAKQKAEDALSELQVTQKQLIQSEKMASLGELTAGIAHEIQNPLNFVNNFSEVSKELLDEMRTALENGDKEEAEEIANDIISNLEKINHHGKRADAIVKGMLQHSRKNEGKKEPTDINALVDEYLRLSYHGLRAKDKSFNANFTTDFDESIGKINIILQDIGRALLNIINNAFYAVSKKKIHEQSSASDEYEPTVSIQTKKLNDNIEIIVTDNGNGIPSNIIDKIFQPFFTTKPTGQGTGLGLSLAYDIITKEHNGTIDVETNEGEYSKFIIQIPKG